MTYLVTATWHDAQGHVCGAPSMPAVHTQAEVQRQVEAGFHAARQARGTQPMCQVTDDRTGRCIASLRPRRARV